MEESTWGVLFGFPERLLVGGHYREILIEVDVWEVPRWRSCWKSLIETTVAVTGLMVGGHCWGSSVGKVGHQWGTTD